MKVSNKFFVDALERSFQYFSLAETTQLALKESDPRVRKHLYIFYTYENFTTSSCPPELKEFMHFLIEQKTLEHSRGPDL
jgi:hypothetical protein